ncbi:hypothetical protein BGZ76_008347 [Entomortierella beljakovae]|nr:hypothetical protein BGZ76_008347 [Entomortierella beljakovae]
MVPAQNPGLCKELDEMVLEYMALVDEHLATWTRITDRFQQGREQISEAKYIMGPRNVSSDCYDLRMKALRGVTVNGPKDIVFRDLWAEQKLANKQALEIEQDQIRSRQASENGDGTINIIEDDSRSNRSGLRRRGGGGGSGSDVGSSSGLISGTESMTLSDNDSTFGEETLGKKTARLKTESTGSLTTLEQSSQPKATKKKRERNPDPLLWFGVFVPPSLRSAQSQFQMGLHDVIALTTIRQRLFELEKNIIALKKSKSQLK